MKICRVAGTVGIKGLALSTLCCGVLASSPSFAQSSSFQGVGFLPGGTYSRMSGVSADGSIVIGYGSSAAAAGNDEAFRWTSTTGIAGLGLLPGATYSYSNGISADGLTIVGESDSAASGNSSEAFRWTQATGMVGLGFLTGGTQSNARAASADGSVIVGAGDSAAAGGNYEAYRWTQGTGMVGLGFLAGGSESYATGVSADGSVVVGGSASTVAGGNYEAFRWTQGTGMVGLGLLTGGTQSNASAVSADGNVVVGFGTSAAAGGNYEAFRWTQGTGIVGLGFLPGGTSSSANATNATGSVVVGHSSTAFVAQEAFRWTQANGMQSVNALLVAAGVNTTGWSLERADGVSSAGNIIVGSGVNPGGQAEAWIARLCDFPANACAAPSLITLSNQLQSLSSLGAVGQTASASLAGNFGTVTSEVMQNGNATKNGSRFSMFTAFGYDSDPTVSGTLGGTAKLNDRGLLAGATVGADNIHTTNMSDGGSARMNAGTAGLFIAQVPEEGLQWLIGANAIYLSGRITRGYINGASQVNSTGSTHGTGYGLAGRIGYTFADLLPRTRVTPFVSYAYTRVGFSGYTESDGPVPAMIDSFHDIQQVSRVGADLRYTFRPGLWSWGTLAWGHRLDGGQGPDVSGTLIGLFPLSASGGTTTQRDWLEATAGVRFGLWTNGAMTASLTANVPTQAPTTYFARIGLSQAF